MGDGPQKQFIERSGASYPGQYLVGERWTLEVCFVGDDARPPWNHASSALTKRMMECLSPRVNCTLVTTLSEEESSQFKASWNTVATRSSGRRALDAAKLGMVARRCSADVIHIVGTNALVFSPVCKLLRAQGAIVRQIFTPYDRRDGIVRPFRRFVNNLFVGAYAFTTPWIGGWDRDLGSGMRKFLVRPPIDCELYRPSHNEDDHTTIGGSHEFSLL